MRRIQPLIRALECAPPSPQSRRVLPGRKVGVQNDAIDAIVTTLNQLLVPLRECVHEFHQTAVAWENPTRIRRPTFAPKPITRWRRFRTTPVSAAPQGTLFPSAVSEKAGTTTAPLLLSPRRVCTAGWQPA